jgi:glycosyltransferase involved in cell wall biosynthesis
MRILVFTDGFPPYISGVTTAAVNQVAHLADRGHDVVIVSPSPSNVALRLAEHDRVQINRMTLSLRWPFLNGLWLGIPTFLKSLALLKSFAPDIVHLHSEGAAGLEGLLASRLLGLPIIGNFSTLFASQEYLRSYHIPSGPFFQWLMWRYQRWFFNSCDLVIVPSKTVRDLLQSRGLMREIEIVSNGTDQPTGKYEHSMKDLRRQYGCSDTFNLIYVGRVSKEKSLGVALAAFDKISKKYSQARFIIIGDGNYMSQLRRHIAKATNQSQYILLGEIPHDDLIGLGLFRLGDVFVMPSKTETEGIAMREAMAFGIPVIAVAANASAEVVSHAFNGLLATPDSSEEIALLLEELLGRPQQLAMMSKNAGKTANKYWVKYTVGQLEEIYSSLAKQNIFSKGQGKQKPYRAPI